MESIDHELSLLKDAVKAAFAGTKFHGKHPENIVNDIFGERERLAPLFLGKKWEDWVDNPLGMFAPHPFCGGLLFMDPDAFRYYLPVLLLACTAQRNQCPNLDDELIRMLTRPEDEHRQFWHECVVGELTKPQLLAVLQALEFIDKHGGPSGPPAGDFHAYIARASNSVSHFLKSHEEPG